MDDDATLRSTSGTGEPPALTSNGWMGMTAVVALLAGALLAWGVASALTDLEPGRSFVGPAFLVGSAFAIAVFSIMVAVGSVRFAKR